MAATTQGFTQPSGALVSETYAGLHNPEHAGLVPVALGETTYRNAQGPCVFFDWDGAQYTYQPDRGTTMRSLPRNPFTDLPYLCLKNGALAECVYFSATYSRKFPGQKTVVVPGDPAFVAFQTDQNLGLFFPKLGYFTLAKDYRSVIDDRVALEKVRARIVALQGQPGAKADAIPEQIPGDDGDMQMRRAFLACQEAGLVCHLHEEGPPWFDFARDGLTYVYASDQMIHVPNAPASGAQAAASDEPSFKVPAIQPVQLAGPAIPDREPEIPDLGKTPAPMPAPSAEATSAEEAPLTAKDTIVMMPPLVVATTRIAKNPWRYVSIPGFEVLSRASEKATTWDLDGLRHGLWIQQAIIPKRMASGSAGASAPSSSTTPDLALDPGQSQPHSAKSRVQGAHRCADLGGSVGQGARLERARCNRRGRFRHQFEPPWCGGRRRDLRLDQPRPVAPGRSAAATLGDRRPPGPKRAFPGGLRSC